MWSKPTNASTGARPNQLTRGQRALQEAAARSQAALGKTGPRVSTVVRQPTASQTLASAAAAKADEIKAGIKNAPRATLRFVQFLRAYMKAFAVGFGAYLLLTELAAGHFNIVQAVLTHLFAIVASPFYALMMAPAIFSLYAATANLPIRDESRAYAMVAGLGVVVLLAFLPSMRHGDASALRGLLYALATIAACAIAARTFNAAVAPLRAASPETAPRRTR